MFSLTHRCSSVMFGSLRLTFTYSGTAATIAISQPCPLGSSETSQNTTAGTHVCTPITDWTGGQINAQPLVICDPLKGAGGFDSTGTPVKVNTQCFERPTALGQIGNMPRDLARVPPSFNTDLAFFKNIPPGEGKRNIQLRRETYNLFNRANYKSIDNSMTFGLVTNNPSGGTCSLTNVCTATFPTGNISSFGAVTDTRSPRVMQGSIRLNF